jgi:hypothetical protein
MFIELATMGGTQFLYLSIITWVLPEKEIVALRERMQQLVYGLFPQKETPRYASAPPETASS